MFTKRFFGTVAVAALLGGTALAESHATADMDADANAEVEGSVTGTVEGTEGSVDMNADAEVSTDADAATAEGTSTDSATVDTTVATDAASGADAMVDVDLAQIDPNALNGARVYDQNDKWIGEISQIILGADGTANQAVIDVGGFLGIGEKPVALPFDDLSVKSEGEANYSVWVSLTEAELEAMPDYEG